jgi:hypothetical protein
VGKSERLEREREEIQSRKARYMGVGQGVQVEGL